MNIAPFYEKKFEIGDSHVDFCRQLKLSEMLSRFQDVATVHAGMLNCGFQAMRERGYFWVLSRVELEILRAPKVGECVTVRTFPEKPLPLQCNRCYTMETEAGERLVNGYSMWCVLDLARNRLTPIRNIGLRDPISYMERDFDANLEKILEEPGAYVYTKQVRMSDLDANIHMNNTRYADVIADAFSMEEWQKSRISRIQINYLGQARAGDEIRVTKKEDRSKGIFVQGQIDETACFAAKLDLTKR